MRRRLVVAPLEKVVAERLEQVDGARRPAVLLALDLAVGDGVLTSSVRARTCRQHSASASCGRTPE